MTPGDQGYPQQDPSQILQKLAQGAKDADDPTKQVNEDSPKPSLDTKNQTPLVAMDMSQGDLDEWWARVERSEQRTEIRARGWDILLNEYLPVVSKSGEAETVKSNLHFRNVHSKMGSLFYRSPELILTAKAGPSPARNTQMMPPTQPGAPPQSVSMEDIIAIKQAYLNELLSEDEIDAEWLMDELLFDILGWSGIGCSKLGYRCVTQPVQQPKMVPAPAAPSTNPLIPASQSMSLIPDPSGAMETVPVPIFEEYYWSRFSPKKLLLADDLKSGRVDKNASWAGMIFFMSPKKAQLPPEQGGLGLTEDEANKASQDDKVHEYDEDKQGSERPPGLIKGYEISCKASAFTDEPHPQAMNQLILVSGIKTRPIVWRPSPDQSFDEKHQLTKDSLIGFPIRVLTIRDLADSPFAPSDAAFTNSGIKQIGTWRRQSIKLRDVAAGKLFYDKGKLDETELDLLKNGEVGEAIGLAEGSLSNGADKVVALIAQPHATQDDYRGAELLKRDNDETLGIGSTQAGTPEATVQTATQIAALTSAVSARNDKERGRVLRFFLQGVRMLDQLIMRYADDTQYALIAGTEGAEVMKMWNRQLVQGKFIYKISPDSMLQADSEQDYRLLQGFYVATAQDALVNRPYVLKRLARMRGLDPRQVVMPPPPPQPPKKEEPTFGFSFKGEDLMVIDGVPVNPIAFQLAMRALGPTAAPPPGTAGSLPLHGGQANKHLLENNSGHVQKGPLGQPNQKQDLAKTGV